MEPLPSDSTVEDYSHIPSYQYIGLENAYAITISPPSRIGTEYLKIGNKSYKYGGHQAIFHDDYRVIIRALKYSVDFVELYPELTTCGRLHYHGVIHIVDMIKWQKHGVKLLNRLGFLKICKFKTVGWIKYFLKEWETTKKVLEIEIPITTELLLLPMRESNTTSAIREQKKIKKKQSIYTYFPKIESNDD